MKVNIRHHKLNFWTGQQKCFSRDAMSLLAPGDCRGPRPNPTSHDFMTSLYSKLLKLCLLHRFNSGRKMEPSRGWYRDEFLISTSNKLLQPAAINAAFASDQLYWTKGMPEDSLKKMLSNSLCLGVYTLPKTSSELAGPSPRRQFPIPFEADTEKRTQEP